jgi:hypothetical protein
MTVQGYIFDNQTRAFLPGASIQIVNGVGSPTGGGVAADANGHFSITDPALDAGGQLVISSVGYTSVTVDPGVINASGFIGLDQVETALPAAVVTATIPAKTTNYGPLLAVGGGVLLLALASSRKKKRTMGDTGGELATVAIVGGVAVGAYVFVLKPLLQKFGITPTAQQVATTTAQKTALTQAQQQAAASGQEAESYTSDQYTSWANQIFTLATATSGGIPAATQDQIVNLVIQVNTMVDLQQLIVAFGNRQANCLIFGLDCTTYDLPSFLRAGLDVIHINKINGYLDDQGINYQF